MPTYPYQNRRDTPENWQSANPVLREGEMGIEFPGVVGENGVEIFKFKIGDGVRAWSDLPYASGPAGPSPEYEWNGTSIRFKNPDGTWGEYIDIQGPQGIKGEQGDPGPAGTATPATTTTIGGVIVGNGLKVTPEGCLSTVESETTATQDITFYVRQDGNDSNSGTEDSPQGAWQTLQGALAKIMAWDFRQYQLTLSVGNTQWDASGIFLPNMGKSLIPILKGNGSGTVFNLNGGDEGFFSITPGSSWVIYDMAFALSGSTRINNNGGFVAFNNITFSGTTSSSVIYLANCAKGTISNCSFDCSAPSCILPNAGGQIIMTGNISVSGNYSYIINAINGGFTVADGSGAVFTGSPTGTRYNASLNGVIDTRGGGPNFIPGTSAGTVSEGGVYV